MHDRIASYGNSRTPLLFSSVAKLTDLPVTTDASVSTMPPGADSLVEMARFGCVITIDGAEA